MSILIIKKAFEKWPALYGFAGGLALIVLALIEKGLLNIAWASSASFTDWYDNHEKLANGIRFVFRDFYWVLLAFVIVRFRYKRNVFEQLGLKRGPTLSGVGYAWGAMGIGVLALYFSSKLLIPQNQFIRSFYHDSAPAGFFIIFLTVVIAPISEEITMRGFLYRSFRQNLGIPLSIFFVLCMHNFFHWGVITRSYHAFFCLVALEIMLCIVRERTGNVWNCVLCHAAYNSTQNPLIYIFALALFGYMSWLLGSRGRQMNSPSQ